MGLDEGRFTNARDELIAAIMEAADETNSPVAICAPNNAPCFEVTGRSARFSLPTWRSPGMPTQTLGSSPMSICMLSTICLNWSRGAIL